MSGICGHFSNASNGRNRSIRESNSEGVHSGPMVWTGFILSAALGYSQDHRTQWAGDDWVEQDSYHRTGSQLMGRKRRAGDQLATSPYVDDVVRQRGNRWDTPRKHALFGSDEPDSMTSGSGVVEDQDYGPPDYAYPMVAQSGLLYENDSLKEAWSPSRKLEDAV